MLRLIQYVLLLGTSCLLVSCDPSQSTDFKIINDSSSGLTIKTYTSNFEGELVERESKLAQGYDFYVLEFYDFPACAASKTNHFSELALAFDSIVVTNDIGRLASNTLFDETNWTYTPEPKEMRECKVLLEITLTDEDFQ